MAKQHTSPGHFHDKHPHGAMFHWWMQRITAMVLIPLTLWFVFSLAGIAVMDYTHMVAWIRQPVVLVLLLMLILMTFYHIQLGMQVIFEDYIHGRALRKITIWTTNIICILGVVIGLVALLNIVLY